MPTAPRPHPTGVRRWLVAFLSVLGLLLLQNTHCAAMAMPGPACDLTRPTSSHPNPMRPVVNEIGARRAADQSAEVVDPARAEMGLAPRATVAAIEQAPWLRQHRAAGPENATTVGSQVRPGVSNDALPAGFGDLAVRATSDLASGWVDVGSSPAADMPERVAAHVDSALVVAVDERPAAELPAGVGLACLAVFLALLAGLAIRGVGRSAAAISLWQWPVGARALPALPRALSLAQLCVLRT